MSSQDLPDTKAGPAPKTTPKADPAATLNVPVERCPTCRKILSLCVCSENPKIAAKTKVKVLVLQHPQEKQEDLATAPLIINSLPTATLKVGLSWSNLTKIIGEEADPKRWITFFFGSGLKEAPRTPTDPKGLGNKGLIVLTDTKGQPISADLARERLKGLQGMIFLDGTWSQAKTLWWRNAWLLKTQRAVLQPESPSLYGVFRKEPRKECLSTLESVALALTALGEPKENVDALMRPFELLLEKYKTSGASKNAKHSRPKRTRGGHGRRGRRAPGKRT